MDLNGVFIKGPAIVELTQNQFQGEKHKLDPVPAPVVEDQEPPTKRQKK